MNLIDKVTVVRRLRGYFKGNKTGINGVRAIVEKSTDPRITEGLFLRLHDEKKGVKGSLRFETEGVLLALVLLRDDPALLVDSERLYRNRDYHILTKTLYGTVDEVMSFAEGYLQQYNNINQLKVKDDE
ncbi:hypothetical protein I6H07_13275 [Hafnia alvei]|uniref:hypothetical protein n=1 Tax=Hafnia alvei TaxID=569 RepID=UPI000B750CA8|nr:hypothetical protein [Hafnia alvei]MBI0276747.1 hypothetical protein [Hafnia alvei]PNK99796.1 hypothetical protein CEQ28_020500 [Hafnia alvei]